MLYCVLQIWNYCGGWQSNSRFVLFREMNWSDFFSVTFDTVEDIKQGNVLGTVHPTVSEEEAHRIFESLSPLVF